MVYYTGKPIEKGIRSTSHEKKKRAIQARRLVFAWVGSSARDLQTFLVFSQHPAWVITPVNP